MGWENQTVLFLHIFYSRCRIDFWMLISGIFKMWIWTFSQEGKVIDDTTLFSEYFKNSVPINNHLFFAFSDVPSSTLTLGSSLNASNIKEGDDVYFECSVKANPRPYKITWRHNVSKLISKTVCDVDIKCHQDI